MKIKDMVRKMRKEYGLVQRELADLMNVDFTTVSQWESGKRMISSEMLELMMEKLNVELSFTPKEDIQFIKIPIKKGEETSKTFDDWHEVYAGGNMHSYFKDVIRKNKKTALVNVCNSIETAWVVYSDETKNKLITLSDFKEKEDLEEIDEITSVILAYHHCDEEFVHVEVTSLGYTLFHPKELHEIAFDMLKLNKN